MVIVGIVRYVVRVIAGTILKMMHDLLVALLWPGSLLHICTAGRLVQEIESVLTNFEDWPATVCSIKMLLNDWNVELRDLFPKVSCLVIGSQFELSQLLLI